jgi:lysylphosphatidylglycerol synthetase-like protein (DUF2156 family)
MTAMDEKVNFEFVLNSLYKYSDNPSAFLALNIENKYFAERDIDGVIAYRAAGKYLIQFGGTFASADDKEELLRGFLDFARARRNKVVAIQLQRADADLYARCGFTVNQVGSSYSIYLPEFNLRGSRFVKLRNKISRAERSGLEVMEVAFAEYAEAIAIIDREWLRAKGRHVKKIEFLVGECGGVAQQYRRLFLGTIQNVPVAYISYSPAYGSRPGWLHDLSRRTPGVPPGTMEAINLYAVASFQREATEWLHFGFTPFTGLSPEGQMPAASRITDWFIRFLADHGDPVYPSSTQLAYKDKWAPQLVLPEYLAFHGRARFSAIWQILRVTKSI